MNELHLTKPITCENIENYFVIDVALFFAEFFRNCIA
mgnify:CR=1 FL=1